MLGRIAFGHGASIAPLRSADLQVGISCVSASPCVESKHQRTSTRASQRNMAGHSARFQHEGYLGMTNRNIVRLQILSDSRTPEAISETLGIQGGSSWHAGDAVGVTLIRQRSHGWELRSGLPESASVQEQLGCLLERVGGVNDRVEMLSKDARIVVSCVVYCNEQPNPYLGSKLVHGISALGADLDFDIYWID